MPTEDGSRQQEKRLRFQIKTALISNHDPFPYFQKLAQLINQKKPERLTPQKCIFPQTVGNQSHVF